MSITRYAADEQPHHDDRGPWVLYAEHLALIASEYQRGLIAGGRAGAVEALDRARDAVDAVFGEPHANSVKWVSRRDALAAIDALQTSLSGPAAVRTSGPEPPTSVAPAGEDHGAHVKPIYVDAWDGMAVPYDDHVVAVEAAHAAGMREALADFLTSIDEDDPVYLRGRSDERGRIRKAVEALWIRETVAHENGDIDEKHVWPTPTAFLAVIDNTEDQ